MNKPNKVKKLVDRDSRMVVAAGEGGGRKTKRVTGMKYMVTKGI